MFNDSSNQAEDSKMRAQCFYKTISFCQTTGCLSTFHRLNTVQYATSQILLRYIPQIQTLIWSYLEPGSIFIFFVWFRQPAKAHSGLREQVKRRIFWHTKKYFEAFDKHGGNYIGESMGIAVQRGWSTYSQARNAVAWIGNAHCRSKFSRVV